MTHGRVRNALGSAMLMLAPMLATPALIVSACGGNVAADEGSPAALDNGPAQSLDNHHPEAALILDSTKLPEEDFGFRKRFGASSLLTLSAASFGENYVEGMPIEKAASSSPTPTDRDSSLPEWGGFVPQPLPTQDGTIIYIAPPAKSPLPQPICDESEATVDQPLPSLALPTQSASATPMLDETPPAVSGGNGWLLPFGATTMLVGLLLGVVAWRIAQTRQALR